MAVLKTEGTVFSYTGQPRPGNNVFIFSHLNLKKKKKLEIFCFQIFVCIRAHSRLRRQE